MLDLIRCSVNYLVNRYGRGLAIQSPPVFIVGCGHSGTSLLLAILGSHPKIFPVPRESSVGFKSFKKYLYLWCFDNWTIKNGKARWIEKTPKHIHKIGRLLAIRPRTKILLIIRDGRDVACSFQERFGDLEKGMETWVTDNLAGRKYWDHPDVLVLRYEDLLDSFAATIKQILSFIGEDFEPSILEYYKQPKYFYADNLEKPASVSGKYHKQYRNWQINQPLFDHRDRWSSLTTEEKILVKNIGNDLLFELGYITNRDW